MGFFFILIIVGVVILANASAKKNTASKGSVQKPGGQATHAGASWTCDACGQQGNHGKFCVRCGKAHAAAGAQAATATVKQPAQGGTAARPAVRSASAAPRTTARKAAPTVTARVAPSTGHVVEATSLGGHTHMETSITGVESCPEPHGTPVTVQAQPAAAPATQAGFTFDATAMRNAIIYSEILAKPKALRKH